LKPSALIAWATAARSGWSSTKIDPEPGASLKTSV